MLFVLEIKLINYHCYKKIMNEKRCALCDNVLPNNSIISLCNVCLECADCCIGLEKIDS